MFTLKTFDRVLREFNSTQSCKVPACSKTGYRNGILLITLCLKLDGPSSRQTMMTPQPLPVQALEHCMQW